jgi:hypothetical protein
MPSDSYVKNQYRSFSIGMQVAVEILGFPVDRVKRAMYVCVPADEIMRFY